MKTTVQISDELAEEVKAYMARERVTFRSVVERRLREVLRAGRDPRPFKLRDASACGRGLQAAWRGAGLQRTCYWTESKRVVDVLSDHAGSRGDVA